MPGPAVARVPRVAHGPGATLPALQRTGGPGNRARSALVALQRDAGGLDLPAAISHNDGVFAKQASLVFLAQALVGAQQSTWLGQYRADTVTGDKPVDNIDAGKAKEAKTDFATKLATWQSGQGLAPNGKLDADTLAAVTEATGGTALKNKAARDSFLQWQTVGDHADLEDLNAAGAEANKGDDDARRAQIVAAAESQVGKVSASDRGDGQKVGAERLVEFYRVAMSINWSEGIAPGLTKPGLFLGQSFDKAGKATPSTATLGGPWSWCGIFAMWAVKTVTGLGAWDQKPIGLTKIASAASAKPGDIVHRLGSLNHHAIVKSVTDTDITTINGNGVNQEIHVRTEPLSLYADAYTAIPTDQDRADVTAWEAATRDARAAEAAKAKAKR